MLPVKSVTDALDDEMKRILAEPNFPSFSEKTYPCYGSATVPRICAITAPRSNSRARTGRISARANGPRWTHSMRCSAATRLGTNFHAEPGDTVFMHNTKVLHGRTGFAADSDRLMYRVRAFATCLD